MFRNCILTFFLASSICAAAGNGNPYTLEDCVQEALRSNPGFTAIKYARDSAHEDIGIYKGKYYPDIYGLFGYRRFETHIFLPEGLGTSEIPDTVGPINDWQTGIRLNYTIYDGSLRSSEVGSAEAQESLANEEVNRAQADLTLRVHLAFYEAQEAEDGLDLAKQRLTRSKDHLSLAEQRKEAGAVPKADVTRSRVDVSSAELGIASAESSLRIAKGKLNEAMGKAANEPLEISKLAPSEADPSGINLQESFNRAVDARPEIRSLMQRIEARKKQIGIARSEILPKLRAETGYGWRDDQFVPTDQDWWAGLTLNVPIWDGGTRNHRIAKSKVEVNREMAHLEELKLSVQQEVWYAYSHWLEAHQNLQTTLVMNEQATESLDLTKARYEAGADTINDLLDAELALEEAQTRLNNTKYRLLIARATFLHAAGQL